MNHKTPIIFSIILLAVIIFCLVMFLVSYLSGGEFGMMSIGTKNVRVIYDEEISLKDKDIKKIDIKQDTGNVILKETTDDKIKVVAYGEEEGDIEVEVSSDQLAIDYTKQKGLHFLTLEEARKTL